MKTRIGKIARLPRDIRDQLNHRLENGQTGNVILPWLNALPDVQTVLAQQFNGQPVTQQNLSSWRLGGYLDWLKKREHSSLVREMAHDAKNIATASHAQAVASNMSVVLLAELALALQRTEGEASSDADRFKQLRQAIHTVSQVRRDDYLKNKLALDRDQQAFGQEKTIYDSWSREIGPANTRVLQELLHVLTPGSDSQEQAKQGETRPNQPERDEK